MPDETETPTVTEESFDAFFARENAADRSEAAPVADIAPAAAAAVDAVVPPVDEPVKDEHPNAKRVREATATAAEAKRLREESDKRATDAEARAARAEAELAKTRQPAPQQEPVTETEVAPKIEDFKDQADPYTAWMIATAAHTARLETKRYYEQQAIAQTQRENGQKWLGRLEAARVRIPDFDTRVKYETPVDMRVQPYIANRDDGPDILLYLSEHQDEAQALTRLHPLEQIGRIGEIAGTLKARAAAASGGSAPTPAPISKARAPIQPPVATPIAAAEDDSDDVPFEVHFRRENARERKASHR